MMDEVPRTTLTQRRSEISAGASSKKITKEKVSPESGLGIDKSAALRVGMWIVAIIFVGVGSALLLTNLLTNGNQAETTAEQQEQDDSVQPVSLPVSNPVADSPADSDDISNDNESPIIDDESDNVPSTSDGIEQVASLDSFASTDRAIAATTSGNNLIFNNFRFFVQNGIFYYQFYNVQTSSGEIDPAISLKYSEEDLTVEFSNVRRDNVTGGGNKTSRTINGVRGITGTQTENTGNTSRYKFLLTEKLPARVLVDKDARTITIEIQL